MKYWGDDGRRPNRAHRRGGVTGAVEPAVLAVGAGGRGPWPRVWRRFGPACCMVPSGWVMVSWRWGVEGEEPVPVVDGVVVLHAEGEEVVDVGGAAVFHHQRWCSLQSSNRTGQPGMAQVS